MTFNRNSASRAAFPVGNLHLPGDSPCSSEYPDYYYNTEKKDSLKLSTGEYMAFTHIKEQNPSVTDADMHLLSRLTAQKTQNQPHYNSVLETTMASEQSSALADMKTKRKPKTKMMKLSKEARE